MAKKLNLAFSSTEEPMSSPSVILSHANYHVDVGAWDYQSAWDAKRILIRLRDQCRQEQEDYIPVSTAPRSP